MRFRIIVFWSLLLCSLLGSGASAETEKLVFAVDVIRHGDRSPIAELQAGASAWPQGLGQLTPEGMAQEYQLGSKLRDEYITKTHLLPETYKAGSIYVRSSDIDRTLMSAQCVLLGLYLGKGASIAGHPALPFAYQPIPIHTKPLNEEMMLVVDLNPKFQSSIRTLESSADWKEETAKMQPHFAHWSQLTGTTITDLNQVAGVSDIIRIRQLHKIQLPKGMTAADAKEIIDSGEWVFAQTFKSPEVGHAGGDQLLGAIANYFEQVRQRKTPLKFVLFSSHDTTIASVMGALGVPVNGRPPYASDLSFLLYEEGDKSFLVKIKLNGKSISLPGTTGGSCALQQFISPYKNTALPAP